MSYRSIFFLGLIPSLLFAQPTEPELAQGKAIFAHPSDHRMEIVTGNQTIINWKTFSIDEGQTTHFIQPHAHSTVLNRVTSSAISEIHGALLSNGKVLLINPHGIIFGEKAFIDTQAFIASTLDVLDSEFMKGDSLRFRGNSSEYIKNYGTIKARDGDILLIGRYLLNDGTISAPNGLASLAVGKEILLKPSGSERVYICAQASQQSPSGTAIHNSGNIEALKVRLLADGNPYKLAINHEGRIDALNVQEHQGDIYLVSEGGAISVSGEIHAPGGHVRVLGDRVSLLAGGIIDASSDRKGGEVLFGGSFKGSDPHIYSSIYTLIEKEAQILVNAKLDGNGGRAIVWSNGYTGFYGSIDARGGSRGGNGGLVEVSGKESLDFKGPADRSAPYGIAGPLYLDPSDILICKEPTENMSKIGGPAPRDVIFLPDGSSFSPTSQLHVRDLIAAISAGPVEVSTTSTANGNGDIIINAPLTNQSGYTTPYTLTLTSDRDIIIQSEVQNGGSGGIICNAGRDLHMNGSTHASTLGSKNGNVVVSTERNLFITGGKGQAQIGYDNPTSHSHIFLNVGKDLILNAGEKFALIGHTNTSLNPEPMFITGNIHIDSVGGKMLLKGGNTDFQFCQIGHASPNFSPSFSNHFTASGDINIQNVAEGITLVGGTASKGAYTLIGHGGRASSYNNTYRGDVFVSAKGPISLFGSLDQAPGKFCGIGFAQDFTGVATNTFRANRLVVHSDADLLIRGGHGSNHTFIGAYTGDSTVGTTQGQIGVLHVSGRKIELFANAHNGTSGSDAAIGILGNNHSFVCNTEVIAKETLKVHALGNGEGRSRAYIQNGDVGKLHILVQTGDLHLFSNGRHNTSYIASGGDLNFNVQRGDLYVISQGNSYVFAEGEGEIYTGSNIHVYDNAIKTKGNLHVQAGQSIYLGQNGSIENSGKDLLILAGKDLNMAATSHIDNIGGQNLTIAVDHDVSRPKECGMGRLIMSPGSSINGSSPVRIFTSKQELNRIEGTINNTSFSPGLLYSNHPFEEWLAFFDKEASLPEGAFKIFYKDGIYSFATVERSQVLISEMLTNLYPYDEYLGWFLEFQTAYDMNAYEKLHVKGTSSFQVNPDQLYYLRMKKNFDHNPKIHHMILFPKNIETYRKSS
jgi:filamentous hemagglutinin family protein